MRADDFITSLGFSEAYRVGGSVRDELLGRKPKDADYVIREVDLSDLALACSRAGARVTKLTPREGLTIGVRAHVKELGCLEIALPRTEVSTGPSHQDFDLAVDPSLPLEVDATRRDFTINALYRRVSDGELIDPLAYGRQDVEDAILRTTHPSSFRDDPLRILRALRFVSKLPRFEFATETYAQMVEHSQSVTGLTKKGVSGTAFNELCKLLMGRRPAKALRIARDTGVLGTFLPELYRMLGFEQESAYHDMTTDEHTFAALDAAAGMHVDLRVRLALLFHDAGKPDSAWKGEDGRLHYYENKAEGKSAHEDISAALAGQALSRLGASARLRNDVVTLVQRHMVPLSGKVKATKVRRWRVELGDDLLCDLLKHRLCDLMGKGSIDYSAVTKIAKMEEIREDAVKRHVPAKAKELPVNGHDLMELGLEGQAIGKVQKKLLDDVVCQPSLNDRDWLLNRAKELARKA